MIVVGTSVPCNLWARSAPLDRSLTESRQLYHLELDGGRCEQQAPDPLLGNYIDYYWMLTIEQPSLVLEVIPDMAVDLVISPDIPDFAALYFPVSSRFSIELEGPVRYAGVCVRSASASELFCLNLDSLSQLKSGADTIKALLIGPLLAEIQKISSITELAAHLDAFWLQRIEAMSVIGNTRKRISHQELINVLEDSLGTSSIASICDALGVSERQFRRLSRDLFGMSPKKLQNILRLQAALEELFACKRRQVHDLYYDDSHRIRELKRLTGCTPEQIRRMAEKYNER